MVNIKYINRDPQDKQQNLWWFPYSLKMLTTMRAGVEFLFNAKMSARLRVMMKTITGFARYLLLNKKTDEKL